MLACKPALVALCVLGATALGAGAASAMPNGLPQADQVSKVEQVRWVCGPYRCWWRPNFYRAYGYYGGPRFHRWHHHGWGRRW